MKHKKLSRISAMHVFKLVFRTSLLLVALVLYIVSRANGSGDLFGGLENRPAILFIIWTVFVIEMVLRFFPSKTESMGCQKQFRGTFRPVADQDAKPQLLSTRRVIEIGAGWIGFNLLFAVLYWVKLFDAGIMLLIALAFSVCDMICILFFCPFQSWWMKNKCCTSCRIYNWDYAMMFTPLVFIPDFFAQTLFLFGMALLVRWEITAYRHPERFSERTNDALACKNCEEKLCHHKKHLAHLAKKLREQGRELLR